VTAGAAARDKERIGRATRIANPSGELSASRFGTSSPITNER